MFKLIYSISGKKFVGKSNKRLRNLVMIALIFFICHPFTNNRFLEAPKVHACMHSGCEYTYSCGLLYFVCENSITIRPAQCKQHESVYLYYRCIIECWI